MQRREVGQFLARMTSSLSPREGTVFDLPPEVAEPFGRQSSMVSTVASTTSRGVSVPLVGTERSFGDFEAKDSTPVNSLGD